MNDPGDPWPTFIERALVVSLVIIVAIVVLYFAAGAVR